MNVLRELRKFKTKSVIVKLRLIILLAAMLIGSAYAWFYVQKDVSISNIRGQVVEWDIGYYMDDEEIQEKEITIAVEDFYPGVPDFEKEIIIRNKSKTNSDIDFEVTSVKLFGEEILSQVNSNNSITEAGTTRNIFSNNAVYPFNAGFSWDRDSLIGDYVDDETTPDAVAKVTFFANWSYTRSTSIGVTANDQLDTKFGQQAYDYYQRLEQEYENTISNTIANTVDEENDTNNVNNTNNANVITYQKRNGTCIRNNSENNYFT